MKKIIAVILALTLAVLTSASVYGTSEKEAVTPTIVVSGMNFNGLVIDKGTENERSTLGQINAGEIVAMLVFGIVKTVVFMDVEGLTLSIFNYAENILKGYSCDENGDSVYNVSTDNTYPLSAGNYERFTEAEPTASAEDGVVASCIEQFGGDHTYFYYYDWRLDPFDNADGLNDMVNLAMEEAGADKVNIICCSMGGVETVAYMTEYGTDKINSCIFLCSTVNGAYVVSDILNGRIQLTEDAAMNFIRNLAKGSDLEGLIKFLEFTKLSSAVCSLAGGLIDSLKEGAFQYVLKPNFATMPVLWALVLPEEYESAKKYCFEGEEEKYATLIQRADKLQEMMRNRDAMLKNAVNNGMKIAFVANYNLPLIPVYTRAATQGDGILETALMAGGATVSDIGKTLDVPAGKYVSADKAIDASTCLYPDYTWFVKDAPHIACRLDSTYSDFIMYIITSETQVSVTSNPLYPQFMYADGEQNVYELK